MTKNELLENYTMDELADMVIQLKENGHGDKSVEMMAIEKEKLNDVLYILRDAFTESLEIVLKNFNH